MRYHHLPRTFGRQTDGKQTEGPCRGYGCSKFFTFEDPAINEITADLTNETHPIFRPNKFIDDIDYSVLEMPLRLASRLIMTDALVPYIETITAGWIKAIHGPLAGQWISGYEDAEKAHICEDCEDQVHTCPVSVYPRTSEVWLGTYDERCQAARIMIDTLEPMVCYQTSGEGMSPYAGAMAHRLWGCLTQDMAAAWPEGRLTMIGFASGDFQELAKLHYEYYNATDEQRTSRMAEALLLARLNFVHTILHELGHALGFAAGTRRCTREPFYKDHYISELGMELESELSGGLIRDSNFLLRRLNICHPKQVDSDGKCCDDGHRYSTLVGGRKGCADNNSEGAGHCRDAESRTDAPAKDETDDIHAEHNKPDMGPETVTAHTNAEDDDYRPFLYMMVWPGAFFVNTYPKVANAISCYRRPKRWDTLWRVPLAWAEKQFTTEFWEVEVALAGYHASKPPRTMGWTFSHQEHLVRIGNDGRLKSFKLWPVKNGDPNLPPLIRRAARRTHFTHWADHYAPLSPSKVAGRENLDAYQLMSGMFAGDDWGMETWMDGWGIIDSMGDAWTSFFDEDEQ